MYIPRCVVFPLLQLPNLVLVNIFRNFHLQFLLQVVSRTCKTLHSLVHSNSVLCEVFEFDHRIELSIADLQKILSHSKTYQRFMLFSGALDNCRVCDIDYTFIKYFQKAEQLYWLNVTDAPISTLGFIVNAPNIQLLNLSGCKNLLDVDFAVIADCTKLDQLYLSFTHISPETLVSIIRGRRLTVLDICNVQLSIEHCEQILAGCWETLLYFHLSLQEGISSNSFRSQIEDIYIDISFRLYPWRSLV